MKGMKGKFLRKLKNIQAIGTLRQGLVFQVKTTPNQGNDEDNILEKDIGLLSKQLKEKYNESVDSELISVNVVANEKEVLKENSPMFPKETTKMEQHEENHDDHDHNHEDHDHDDQNSSSLMDFEEKCPPGGSDKVVLYTTSLRGIRKTFEDCSAIRFLLESYKVSFLERDVSLHKEFREELWEVLEEKVLPPRLFIKGRYIGGAEEVVGVLNEQGKLKKLLEGVPLAPSNNAACVGCANVRFSVCFNCNGSRKVLKEGEIDEFCCYIRCPECNENGLVKCEICCSV